MMKKLLIAALGSAALLALPNAANAAQGSAQTGVTFQVVAACSINGNVANLGSFSTADTWQSYANRQGIINAGEAYTAGSDAPVVMAAVTCPTGTAWSAYVGSNAGNPNGASFVTDQNNNNIFGVGAVVTRLDAATIGPIIANGASSANFVTSTGTAAPQLIAGQWPLGNRGGNNNLATAFVVGTYTALTTVFVNY